MQLLVPFTLLLVSLTSAIIPNFPVCPFNLFSKYYLIFGPSPSKSAQEQKGAEQFTNGMGIEVYPFACAYYGLRPANITADIVPELLNLLGECLPAKQIVPGMWIESYEGLVPAFGCNALMFEGTVASAPIICDTYALPALCEILADPVDVTTFSVTDTETSYEETTTQETSTLFSTETLTTYYVTRLTTVLTQGTNAYTTITTTSTACSTITRTHTSSCCHHNHHRNCKPCKTTTTTTSTRYITPTCDSSSSNSCSSSSSSSSSSHGPCCPPNHYLHRHQYPRGCHDCGKKMNAAVEEDLEWSNARIVKAQEAPNAPVPLYVQCSYSLNNFYLVKVNGTKSFDFRKSQELANINGQEACAALGYNLANITIPILDNLYPLFATCNVLNTTNVVFNSYYSWMPLCGYLQIGPSGGVGLNDVNPAPCSSANWALCRAGPTIATTLTVPTGPFTTETVVVVQTATELVVATVVVAETVTQSNISTVTATSYYPVTATSQTTVPTTTVTSTQTSMTSCCCNPVVCTTVQECCKPKPICQKPHCRKH